MLKIVSIGDGREVRLHVDLVDGRYALNQASLWHGKWPVGALYRDEDGRLVTDDPFRWFYDRQEEERAIAWYAERYPDLADSERRYLLVTGFLREADAFAPLIARAEELAATLNQREPGPYVAVDVDGRVRAIGDTAFEAVDDAEYAGWEGWYSLAQADDDTLWVTPASSVRVKL
jgi:hypothetical protein